MLTDLRFALRQLAKSPGFTFLAVATLALGIGLNTAIFSLINEFFLRSLPFREPSRLVHLLMQPRGGDSFDYPLSGPRFMHYRDGQKIFDGFAAETGFAFTLTGRGEPVQVQGFRTTANYFDVLGVRPILGRTFQPAEEEGADVALVSEQFWKHRLGGEPNVLGRSITLDGVPHTIIGVLPNMPAQWVGPNGNEVWTTKPYVIAGFSHERMMRGTAFLRVIGRLKPGQTVAQVQAALVPLSQSYHAQNPAKIDVNETDLVKTLPEDVNGDLRPAFATLLAAVAFVLLIACSNVANLLLVRFSGRRRDFDAHDLAGRRDVMLISQSGARKVFGHENPIGKLLLTTSSSVPTEIVGVVGDVRSERIAKHNEMEFYRPWAQENFPFLTITVRSALPATEIAQQTQRALSSIDPSLAIAQPQMMQEIVNQALGQARLSTILLGIFAGVALLLATVGIYGAVAYTVEQRTGEIGVRMALGAQTLDILRLIVRQGMQPVVIGLAVGLVAALALGRLLASQLYQVSSYNPVLLALTMIVLAGAALLACLFPARRASRLDPVRALRTQ